MTTITITFERMPGLKRPSNAMMFVRDAKRINRISLFTLTNPDWWFCESCADCHPSDTFSWETGMRLCVKRAATPEIYRAFRRWMWLAKAEYECSTHYIEGGCYQCWDCYPWYARVCLKNGWQGIDMPAMKIAREFGRVTVEVK